MSSFMDWALSVASEHPDLSGAFINADGEWLDVLLADGRTVRFRPLQMLDPDAPEPDRRKVLNRLIDIGVKMAKPADVEPSETTDTAEGSPQPGDDQFGPAAMGLSQHPGEPRPDRASEASSFLGPAIEAIFGGLLGGNMPEQQPEESNATGLILPIVRPADYFITSHDHSKDDSMVYIPLTDYVGVGLAEDTPDTIQPIYYSDLSERGIDAELGPLFGDSVSSLRELNMRTNKDGLELGVAKVAGAEVFLLTQPANYQSSWFCDLDMAQNVAESLSKENRDSLPLFVPAGRTTFFVIMADDPHLADVFSAMRSRIDKNEVIYPLPHTVAADGWQEWIPMPDHPAANLLSESRAKHRGRIYGVQVQRMAEWDGELGTIKDYEIHQLKSGPTVTLTKWEDTDGHGSIPRTDYISFVSHGTGLPWDENHGETLLVRSTVARDVWPEGIQPSEGVWPPRYRVIGFPDEKQMEALREASHREV